MMLKREMENGSIKDIKLNRFCPSLSHLLFVDDLILFLEGKLVECQNVAMILNQYCFVSGQAINLSKFGMLFSKDCPREPRSNLTKEMRVPELEKIGKYLGIPSDWSGSKKQMFNWILARVNIKLEGWK